MTSSLDFLEKKRKKRTVHHQDLETEDLVPSIMTLSFLEVLVAKWEEEFSEHKVYLIAMIISHRTELDFLRFDQILSVQIFTITIWIHILDYQNRLLQQQELCKTIELF